MVRQWQQLFFEKRYSSTEIVNPDFTTIAKGYGIESQKVSDQLSLNEALDKMIHSKNAFLLEAVVAKEENVFPMVASGAAVDEVRLK